MKALAAVIIAFFLAVLVFVEGDLPRRGDPQAPAHQHVAPYYIQRSLADTKTPNLVTAVLADYRGYDTLGETVVIFVAGLSCILILLRERQTHGG
ncbi:MAG: hypothetical protein NZ951_02305 [Dehalococcoidia bacterium]|nr:hypothetical protein [Dehalococcoidia bacterium]MDW8119792.1 hypothetical protein [Chloroflexota bacterium]